MPDRLDRLNTALNGRFRVDRHVDTDGVVDVYFAEDSPTQRSVVLKVVREDLAASVDGEHFSRALKERPSPTHPHLVPILDAGGAAGVVFYALPRLHGETLRQHLDRETRLNLQAAIRVTQQVAAALDVAHRQGAVHGDMRPDHILLQGGDAMTTDFGVIPAIAAAGATVDRGAMGTAAYSSPEIASGAVSDAHGDVYALAAVTLEMLVGRPLRGDGAIDAPTGSEILAMRGDVPSAVAEALAKALGRARGDRFASARDFAAVLSGSRRGSGHLTALSFEKTEDPAVLPQPGDAIRWKRLALLAGAIAAVAVVAVLWILLGGG